MAQIVGYMDDEVTFKEGPFVLTNPLGNGWRIECQIRISGTPVLPDISIYRLLDKHLGHSGKWPDKAPAVRACDFLNQRVRDNHITRVGDTWRVA